MKRMVLIASLALISCLAACDSSDDGHSSQLGLSRLDANGMTGAYRAENGVTFQFEMDTNDEGLPRGAITRDGRVVWSYSLSGGALYATTGGFDLRQVAVGDPAATSGLVAFLGTADGVALREFAQDLAAQIQPEDPFAYWVRYVIELDNALEQMSGGTSVLDYPHLWSPGGGGEHEAGGNCPSNCSGCIDGCPFVQYCLFCLSCEYS